MINDYLKLIGVPFSSFVQMLAAVGKSSDTRQNYQSKCLFPNSHFLIESIKVNIPTLLINCSRQSPNFGEIGGRTLMMKFELQIC